MIIETNSPPGDEGTGQKNGGAGEAGRCVYPRGRSRGGKDGLYPGDRGGLGIDEPVNSPTFTIVQEYESGRMPFYHFDVYRIGDPEEMDEIGFDDYIYGDGLCLIEWADLIEEILPEKRSPFGSRRIWKKDLITAELPYRKR